MHHADAVSMIGRRSFIAGALGLMGCALRGGGTSMRAAPRLPLSFSTLGCPDWSLNAVLDCATSNGFAGVELRGLAGTLDVTTLPEFLPPARAATKRLLDERAVQVISLDASAQMHESNPVRRDAHMAEVRRYVDVAQALGTPYVRVFGDKYPAGESKDAVLTRVAAALRELGEYAGPRGVTILLEAHGDFTDSATLLDIMRRTASPHVALLWDAHHTFVSAGETPEYTMSQIGRYVRHVHLKDSVPSTTKERQYVLTGAGQVPVRRQVEVLAASGYRGLYSFEWEKKWHPEIEDPSVAIPHYAMKMREYLGNAARAGASGPA